MCKEAAGVGCFHQQIFSFFKPLTGARIGFKFHETGAGVSMGISDYE
jgi:hypothetical protein